jgi:hypothetical protein
MRETLKQKIARRAGHAADRVFQPIRDAMDRGELTITPSTEPPPDAVCEHGTALDVHCCNCHSGFLFSPEQCVCETSAPADLGLGTCPDCGRALIDCPGQAVTLESREIICEPCNVQRLLRLYRDA